MTRPDITVSPKPEYHNGLMNICTVTRVDSMIPVTQLQVRCFSSRQRLYYSTYALVEPGGASSAIVLRMALLMV